MQLLPNAHRIQSPFSSKTEGLSTNLFNESSGIQNKHPLPLRLALGVSGKNPSQTIKFSGFFETFTAVMKEGYNQAKVLAPQLIKSKRLSNIFPAQHPDLDLLTQHVATLSKLPRYYPNFDGLNQAADYIQKNWEAQGLTVETQTFDAPGRKGKKELKNLMVSFGPEDGERIIVGAHYDVCTTEYPGGHKPGADDNASGVAGILELARLLKVHQPKLKYRIDLVAYTTEEPPMFRSRYMGSAVHAESLYVQKAKVKGMLALDMIGYFTEAKNSQHYPPVIRWFYPSRGNFIGMVGDFASFNWIQKSKLGMKRYADLPVRAVSAPNVVPGIDFSDHQNYTQYGWPALMVTDTAFYRNHHYHKNSDTIETLNFPKMAQVVKGLYGLIINV